MHLSFLRYYRKPEVLLYRICFSNFLTLLRANCQFINIFLLVGAWKLSKANCSTSHCVLHDTLFSTTLYSLHPMLSKSLGHNPSFLTCCPDNSINEQPLLQQNLITIPQLPWAQLSPAGADSCVWAFWWPQVRGSSNTFSHVSPCFRGPIWNAAGDVPASPCGGSAGGVVSAGPMTLQNWEWRAKSRLLTPITYVYRDC